MGEVCSVCGRVADAATDGDPPLTWSVEVTDRSGQRWTCATCTRDNVRSIEAKLDQEWW